MTTQTTALPKIKSFNDWISFESHGGEGVTGDLVCPNCSDCFLKNPDAVIVMDPDPIKQCIVCDVQVKDFKKINV